MATIWPRYCYSVRFGNILILIQAFKPHRRGKISNSRPLRQWLLEQLFQQSLWEQLFQQSLLEQLSLAVVSTTLVWTAVPTIIIGTAVPTIIIGTAVSTIFIGTTVTSMTLGTKISLVIVAITFLRTVVPTYCWNNSSYEFLKDQSI